MGDNDVCGLPIIVSVNISLFMMLLPLWRALLCVLN